MIKHAPHSLPPPIPKPFWLPRRHRSHRQKKPGCSAKLLLSWMHGDIMVMLEKNVDSKTSSIILAIPATVLPKVSVSNNMTQFNNDLAIEEFHEEIRARLEMGTIWWTRTLPRLHRPEQVGLLQHKYSTNQFLDDKPIYTYVYPIFAYIC